MSVVCPVDLKPCCDDVCRGAGCVQAGGDSMLHVCATCGDAFDYFIVFECDDCSRDRDGEDDFYDEETT